MGYTVRESVAGDWQAYRELRLAALRDPAAPVAFFEPYEEASALARSDWELRARSGESRVTFVGEQPSGDWAGMVAAFVAPGGHVQIVGVYVRPEHRGSGLAGELMRAAVRWAGSRDVRLHVHERNGRAARFYESLGFRPTGVRERDPQHQDAFAYELALPHAFPESVRLAGQGVVLREWTEQDLPAMPGLFDDPDVDRWTPMAGRYGPADARETLRKVREGRGTGQQVQLAVTSDGGQALGTVLLFRHSADRYSLEVGYAIGAAYRGRELAVRAVRVMVAFGYQRLHAREVLARIQAANESSVSVVLRAGFEQVEGAHVVEPLKGRMVRLETYRHVRTASGV